MKSSIWRRCRRLRLESLEDRTVPTGMPHLVRDIDPRTLSANPHDLVAVGSTVYFADYDGHSGLWKSDGTATGTTLVKEIYLGGNDYQPIRYLTNVGGTIFFSGDDGTHGRELWKTDGTTAGTVLVADINPGGDSSPGVLTNINGTLYFSADDGAHGREMWMSDGTAAGTVMLKDINVGATASMQLDSTTFLTGRPVLSNGTVFFPANDGVHGMELWKTDGTAAGTVMLKDINLGSPASSPGNLIDVNGTLYFDADDGAHGMELWKSNGTAAGTTLVRDIWQNGVAGSFPGGYHGHSLAVVNGTLYFSANDGNHGYELWKSDGTVSGTKLVKDVRQGSANSYPSYLTNFNGTVYFSAYNGAGTGLWRSDGTSAGTTLVKQIYTGFGSSIGLLTNVGGTLYFGANDGTHGVELWKSDGAAAGTVMVKDICPGSAGSTPNSLGAANGTVFFAADDGQYGRELWKSDGTVVGTLLVKDINLTPTSSSPNNLTEVAGGLVFTADDPVHGQQVWKSDGTAAGTTIVSNISPGRSSWYYYSPHIANLTNVSGTLFFVADDGNSGSELWKSDGTASGTNLLADIWPGWNAGAYAPFSSAPSGLTNVNGTLFFTANDGAHGRELWKSNGTAAGTVLIKDIATNGAGSYPSGLTNVNGTLYFSADDGTHGYELWKSDGTAAGTVMVADINPGSAGSNPGNSYGDNFVNVNGTLYFSADDSTHGRELWKSDGTAAGTVLVADIQFGSGESKPAHLTNVNGTLYFSANDGAAIGLWKSDGTAAGTILLKDIYSGSLDYSYRLTVTDLTNVNGTLFFAANDVAHGKELWKSDGTVAGTMMVSDVNLGSTTSVPASLTNVNGKLYFSADDGQHGSELWQSDGTAIGTVMVADINPGSAGSLAGGVMTVLNDSLYFAANDGVHGRELWVLPPVPPAVDGVQVNDGSAERSRVTSLTVTFSMQVSFATTAGAAFTLTRNSDNAAVGFTASASVVGGVTVVTLSGFIGSATEFGSLADDRYTLTALASQISANGQHMTSDYIFGDEQGLYRMFGDMNGDRTVNGLDFGSFKDAFGTQTGDAHYLSFLDFDGDGVINGFDFGQFRSRFGTILP